MNTKSLLIRIGVPVLSLGLLGGLGATLATSASASTTATTVSASTQTGTITALTHQKGVLDTTSIPNPVDPQATLPSPDGPVWAHDNLWRYVTATHDSTDPTLWHVVLKSVGSYSAVADPRTGVAFTGSGPMWGEVEYTVHSARTPSAANLSPQTDPSLHSGDILKKFFGDQGLTVSNSMYNFTYMINGAPYNQVG
ncbi:MAG TPA: hypothetical protein VMK84_22680 [Streptosporangiaceae bacterium]|nr:hypothetical protein [Streptosporangiaceae bacterium]